MTRPEPIYPAALKSGDKIGVIAPSSICNADFLTPGVEYLKANGFEVMLHDQTSCQYNQFSGTPEEKISALHDYFADPSIKAIFCTRGGNGCVHLLDKIDYDLIAANPKILIGFSDITSLLHAIYAKTGLITFHGPTVSMIRKLEPQWAKQMLSVLTGESNEVELGDKGNAEGILFGGNVSVFQTLIGTPYLPDLSQAILFLEDVHDHLSRYDRMTGHMKLAGLFDDLNAMIIGEFMDTQDNSERPFGFTIEEIISSKVTDGAPCLANAPIGHGQKLCTLPIGAPAVLKNGTLSFKSLA